LTTNDAGPVIVVVEALIAEARLLAQVSALGAQVGLRVTPHTAMLPLDGTPVKTTLAVDGVAAVAAVPSPSWATPHVGVAV
jgi:hypothetical protein